MIHWGAPAAPPAPGPVTVALDEAAARALVAVLQEYAEALGDPSRLAGDEHDECVYLAALCHDVSTVILAGLRRPGDPEPRP